MIQARQEGKVAYLRYDKLVVRESNQPSFRFAPDQSITGQYGPPLPQPQYYRYQPQFRPRAPTSSLRHPGPATWEEERALHVQVSTEDNSQQQNVDE